MKRSSPLRRYTPLKRSRKPLSPVAKGKMAERRQYAKRAKAYKLANPVCSVAREGCTLNTEDVHHVFGRGKFLLVEATWLPVCRSCHEWIHHHPGMARTLNLLK